MRAWLRGSLLFLCSLSMATAGLAVADAPSPDATPSELSDLSAVSLTISDPSPAEGEKVMLELTVGGTPAAASEGTTREVVIDPRSPEAGRGTICPWVLGSDETGFTMWYVGISDDNVRRIFRATSPDGVEWTDQGVSMERPYPNQCIYPYVVDNGDGTHTMWFTNLNYRYTIMRAESSDGGATWSSPVLEMTYGSSFDFDGVNCPRVLYDGTQWRMWYVGVVWATATAPAYTHICHAHKATLSDPWTKDGVVIDRFSTFLNIKDPALLTTDDGYEMLYTAAETEKIDGIYRITYGEIRRAVSADGLAWATDETPYMVPVLPDEGVCVHQPSILRFPAGDRVWFTGYVGYDEGIGVQRIMYLGPATTETRVDAVCSVTFYVDGAPVGTVDGILVPGDGTAVATYGWTATAGEHAVTAVVHSAEPADSDSSDDAASLTVNVAPATPANLQISKIRLSGPDAGYTHTYYEWELLITVENTGGSPMTEVCVFDVLPAELELLFATPSAGEMAVSDEQATKAAPHPSVEPVRATFIDWAIPLLAPGESADLHLLVCTRVNPGGNQEFTSPGTYLVNEGASASGTDTLTGSRICAGPTFPITVEIAEMFVRPPVFVAV